MNEPKVARAGINSVMFTVCALDDFFVVVVYFLSAVK